MLQPLNGLKHWLKQSQQNLPKITPSLERRVNLMQGDVRRAQINTLEGSVIAGRSAFAFLRDGFLECQERLFEELLVGVSWLNGKPILEGAFDRAYKNRNPASRLNPAIDWSVKRSKSLALSPLELYTASATRGEAFLTTKAKRFALSLFIPLALISAIIPIINQLKTDWLLRHFPGLKEDIGHHKKKHLHPTAKPLALKHANNLALRQPGLQAISRPQAQPGLWPTASAMNHASLTGLEGITAATNFSMLQPQISYSTPNALNTSGALTWPQKGLAVQKPGFGLGVADLAKAGQWVGNFYSNVPYGDLLITDVGLFSGRVYVANRRSKYEAIEGLYRDIVSDYFYLLSLPHAIQVVNFALNHTLGVDAKMDPVTGRALLSQLIAPNTLIKAQQTLLGDALTQQQLTTLKPTLVQLTQAATQIPVSALKDPLHLELAAHLAKTHPPAQITAIANSMLQALHELSPKGLLSQQAAQTYLESLQNSTKYGPLRDTDRENLRRAFKWSLQQTHPTPLPKDLASKLTPQASQRLTQISQRQGLATANHTFKRALQLLPEQLGTPALIDEAEALSEWLDQAAIRGLGLKETLHASVSDLSREIQSLGLYDQFERLSQKQKTQPLLTHSFEELSFYNRFKPIVQARKTLQQHLHAGTLPAVETIEQLNSALRHLNHNKTRKLAQKTETLLRLMDPNRTLTDLPAPVREKLALTSGRASGGVKNTAETLIGKRIDAVLENILAQTPATHPRKPLIQHYQQALQQALTHAPQHPTLPNWICTEARDLQHQLHYIARGGLANDPATARLMMRLTHKLPGSSREFMPPNATQNAHQALVRYCSTLVQQAQKSLEHQGLSADAKAGASMIQKTLWQAFRKNRAFQFANYALALGGTMAGLGILVPKSMMALNRKLTGTDDHPGLAALIKQES
ncbi:MAG: hypothetical protein VKJ06_01920 [Vampirovibrionales bacterium]|nr:hypothetical protein [Vampirovibrionales bacterium]